MKVDFYTPKGRDTKILAFADVTLSEGVVVRGFRVADGSNGVFAAVPSKPITVNGEKRFWNQVAFTSNEIRERFLGELLEDYHRWRKNEAGHPPPEAKASGAEDAEEGPPF
jgi:DNA-binding cell septation regulator SpoVG